MRVGNAKTVPVYRVKKEAGGYGVYRVEFMPRFQERVVQWFAGEVEAEMAARTYAGLVDPVEDDDFPPRRPRLKIAKG